MGSLTLPASGSVYLDTMAIIYTVERYPDYWPLLEPLWQGVQAHTIEVVSSELTLMEVMVKPLKTGDAKLVAAFEQSLLGTDVHSFRSRKRSCVMLPSCVRRRSCERTDAIHAATAKQAGCALFVTNDTGFRCVPGLQVVILDDLRAP